MTREDCPAAAAFFASMDYPISPKSPLWVKSGHCFIVLNPLYFGGRGGRRLKGFGAGRLGLDGKSGSGVQA